MECCSVSLQCWRASASIPGWKPPSWLASRKKRRPRALTSFIAALPDAETAHPDPPRIAARLIALLPRVAFLSTPSRGTAIGVTAANNSRSLIYMLFASVAIVALLIGAQSIMAGHQSSARVAKPFSDVSDTRSTLTPTERVRHQPQQMCRKNAPSRQRTTAANSEML
jgi:hypothetical protein